MEDKLFNLEKELQTFEKNNPCLHINEIKQIKKNAIKLEMDINKLLNCDSDTDDFIDDESNNSENSFNIDDEINKYTKLVNGLNDDSINLKTIEELNFLLKEIEKIENNIINYQRLNLDLDLKTI